MKYIINEVHTNIVEESVLNDSTGYEENTLNVCAYFSNETRVYYGGLGIINVDYLKEHNIPAIYLTYGSGTIVGTPDDLNLSINSPTYEIQEQIIESIADVLREKGVNTTTDGNDILIDDKKFCGCAGFYKLHEEDKFYKMYVHISFGLNRELIEKVRVKPKDKEITCIHEFLPEFTREEFLSLWKEKLDKINII